MKPVTTMVPLANLLKQADDGGRHACAVIDFGACRGPQYDTQMCKRLLWHVTHPSAVRRRVLQLHITNMGPHKPCCRGKVIKFLFGILKGRRVLLGDFLGIHHDASDMDNADIRHCRHQSTDFFAALDGTAVLRQPKEKEFPRCPNRALRCTDAPTTSAVIPWGGSQPETGSGNAGCLRVVPGSRERK